MDRERGRERERGGGGGGGRVSVRGRGGEGSRLCPTHDSNKQISKHKRSYPDPEEDIKASECFVRHFSEVIVYLIPLVKCEQLEQCYKSIGQRTA